MKFSIGDMVGLVKYPHHTGYVIEVIETKVVNGPIPTIIVEWFEYNPETWNFDDELFYSKEKQQE